MLSNDAKHIINLWKLRDNAPTRDSLRALFGAKTVGDYSREIRSRLAGNVDLIIELVFCGQLTDEQIHMVMFDHWGSSVKEDNPTLAIAFPTIYKRRDELTPDMKASIEHMASVYKYPTNNP